MLNRTRAQMQTVWLQFSLLDTTLWCNHVLMFAAVCQCLFQGQILYNEKWFSVAFHWNESHHVVDTGLVECVSWSLLQMFPWAAESHRLLSGPVVAPVFGELSQLVSEGTAWFLAEWADSCWRAGRQVVCTFLDKTFRNTDELEKKMSNFDSALNNIKIYICSSLNWSSHYFWISFLSKSDPPSTRLSVLIG